MNHDHPATTEHAPATVPASRPRRPVGLLTAAVISIVGITGSSIVAVRGMQQGLNKVSASHGTRLPVETSEDPTRTSALTESNPSEPGIVPGDAQHGRTLFNLTCYVCHGPTGAGVPGLGPTLRESKFVASRNDGQLAAFIKTGRQPGDPNSVLNLTMPPNGANPTLTENDLHDVVSFVRTLQSAKQ